MKIYGNMVIFAGLMMMGGAMVALSAQEDVPPPSTTRIFQTTNTDVQEVSVELFEDPTIWNVYIPRDDGYSFHQRFEGSPDEKEALSATRIGGVRDENVLGVKTEFIRRGFTQIVFSPERPVPIPGVVREISLWVSGRDLPHDLYVLIRDVNGSTRKIFVDRLNFRGWQRLTAQIPPYSRLSDGLYTGVRQYDPRRPLDTGIELVSLVIEPLFTEAYGTYYVYFDDMRATTDLSVISLRDPDDIVDAW